MKTLLLITHHSSIITATGRLYLRSGAYLLIFTATEIKLMLRAICSVLLLTFLYACTDATHTDKLNTPDMTTDNHDNSWIKNTNVYEVNVRQYTKEGTFNAFAAALPRLKDMGVQTLWFMPVTPIAQKEKKGSLGSYYAASDYTSINPEFGTLDDFKHLVQQAHREGFKVIIDWVANHTGWDHHWTREHPDWYERDSATNDFKRASGMDDIIELNFSKPELRKAMIEAMRFWITETDIDGFRCDLAFWVELDFWKEAREALQNTKPLFWLGELDPLEHPEYMQVFDAAYTWTWMHTAEDFYKKGLPLSTLDSVLERYRHSPGLPAWFTSNHDENTWNGSEYEKYGDAAKALAVFSCTWPGVPLIYSGQELPNKKRLQFFERDPIEWTGTNELHHFYKTLLHLHTAHPALLPDSSVSHTYRLHTSNDEKIFAYLRKNGDKEVLVLLNLSKDTVHVHLLDNRVSGAFRDAFSGGAKEITEAAVLELHGWGYAVFDK